MHSTAWTFWFMDTAHCGKRKGRDGGRGERKSGVENSRKKKGI